MSPTTRNAIVNRLKKLEEWARLAESALGQAEDRLAEDGCDCGHDDPPCALCAVQYTLTKKPK